MSAKAILDFSARLHQGPTAFAAWCGMTDPAVVDTLLREGYDCAILDWQHGFHDFSSILSGITAAGAAQKPALVRVGVGQFDAAARFLDWGAAGVIAPMINSVYDAKSLVDMVKFPPVGARSWGPMRAMAATGLSADAYLKHANGFSIALAMIETREALGVLDDILAVSGLDGIFVGPGDLSITLSHGAKIDPNGPEVDAALTTIVMAARRQGKIAAAFCTDGARAAILAARGFHLLSVATDGAFLRMGGKAELVKAKAF